MSFLEKKIDSLTLKQVADLTSSFIDSGSEDVRINDIKSIMQAGSGDITFYYKPKYEKFLHNTKATACIIFERDRSKLPKHVIPIISKEPYLAFAILLRELYGTSEIDSVEKQIDGSAKIHSSVKLGNNISIRENVVISKDVEIADNVVIMPNTFIGPKVKIGKGSVIHDNCSIMFTHIGENCIIRSGARVGTSGFGFIPNLKTGQHLQIPQIAGVIIGNNVDIGANTAIDRGAVENTIIEDNVKIDNLVQIAHGVKVGASTFIVSQSGVAGSAIIGKGCLIGAQAGVVDNVQIADFTKCIARAAVAQDITIPGCEVAGFPAIPKLDWIKIHLKLKKLISKK